MYCEYQCYEIGGPWIAENPNCPIHGPNAPKEKTLDTVYIGFECYDDGAHSHRYPVKVFGDETKALLWTEADDFITTPYDWREYKPYEVE